MSRTLRRNRKPSRGKRSITCTGRPYVFRPIPAVVPDGKQERFPFREATDAAACPCANGKRSARLHFNVATNRRPNPERKDG